MNLRTKLQSRENNWIRVYFMDTSELTGVLRFVGEDFIELESYGYDFPIVIDNFVDDDLEDNLPSDSSLTNKAQHLIPINLIKLFTIDTDNFVEEERKRLEYVSKHQSVNPSINK